MTLSRASLDEAKTQPKTRKVGRPTKYSPEFGKEICDTIACSTLSIYELCKANSKWPHESSIFLWLTKHPEFRALYDAAKLQQSELFAEDIVRISNEALRTEVLTMEHTKEGKILEKHRYSDNVARAELQIKSRQWLMKVMNPKKFADNVKLSGDADNPFNLVVEHIGQKVEAESESSKKDDGNDNE